jgi:hypothetical protein
MEEKAPQNPKEVEASLQACSHRPEEGKERAAVSD